MSAPYRMLLAVEVDDMDDADLRIASIPYLVGGGS